jgi:biotin operon repressor
MTQKEDLLKAFSENNNRLTSGQMLGYSWGYTARNRISELRRMGYRIETFKGTRPGLNGYRLIPEQGALL